MKNTRHKITRETSSSYLQSLADEFRFLWQDAHTSFYSGQVWLQKYREDIRRRYYEEEKRPEVF